MDTVNIYQAIKLVGIPIPDKKEYNEFNECNSLDHKYNYCKWKQNDWMDKRNHTGSDRGHWHCISNSEKWEAISFLVDCAIITNNKIPKFKKLEHPTMGNRYYKYSKFIHENIIKQTFDTLH